MPMYGGWVQYHKLSPPSFPEDVGESYCLHSPLCYNHPHPQHSYAAKIYNYPYITKPLYIDNQLQSHKMMFAAFMSHCIFFMRNSQIIYLECPISKKYVMLILKVSKEFLKVPKLMVFIDEEIRAKPNNISLHRVVLIGNLMPKFQCARECIFGFPPIS